MKITHIHARVGAFNGFLFFVVDGRLLRVDVGTPNFNDFNEWRLIEFRLGTEPYKPDENEVELSPYKISDIEIGSDELRMLEAGTRLFSYDLEDSEREKIILEFPDINSICGIMYNGRKRMTIHDWDNEKETMMSAWDRKKDKTPFEKVFYPILEGFRNGYIERIQERDGK